MEEKSFKVLLHPKLMLKILFKQIQLEKVKVVINHQTMDHYATSLAI